MSAFLAVLGTVSGQVGAPTNAAICPLINRWQTIILMLILYPFSLGAFTVPVSSGQLMGGFNGPDHSDLRCPHPA